MDWGLREEVHKKGGARLGDAPLLPVRLFLRLVLLVSAPPNICVGGAARLQRPRGARAGDAWRDTVAAVGVLDVEASPLARACYRKVLANRVAKSQFRRTPWTSSRVRPSRSPSCSS